MKCDREQYANQTAGNVEVMNIEMSLEVERPVVRLGQCESLMVMNKEKCFADFVPQHIAQPSLVNGR